MSKLLSPDNPLMQEISKATDYIIAKFLFIVFSIPIFTIGASACAEYAVIMKIRRGGNAGSNSSITNSGRLSSPISSRLP